MRERTKKLIIKLSIGLVILAAIIVCLNIKVTTQQGINFQVQTIRIPLYLKIIDFMDRHYNYKQLVKRIIKDEHDKQKRVMEIFSWAYHHIKKQPESLPVIDDHVWHIIVRGYGAYDQSCDVFSTLCNYAGIESFYDIVPSKDKYEKILLSFVRIQNRWYVFDPYNGVYFVNTEGKLVDIAEIKSGDCQLKSLGMPKKAVLNYSNYLDNLPNIKELTLRRARIQSPFKRLVYEVRKHL